MQYSCFFSFILLMFNQYKTQDLLKVEGYRAKLYEHRKGQSLGV